MARSPRQTYAKAVHDARRAANARRRALAAAVASEVRLDAEVRELLARADRRAA